MDEKTYLLNVSRVIEELLQNAAHSFGINFANLNETAIETDKRLHALGVTRQQKQEHIDDMGSFDS